MILFILYLVFISLFIEDFIFFPVNLIDFSSSNITFLLFLFFTFSLSSKLKYVIL